MRGQPPNALATIILRRALSRILIVGEGRETEPNYFEAIRTEDIVRERFALTVSPGPGFNPQKIVEHAVNVRGRKKKKFDEVWCVLDVEGPEKALSLRSARALAKAEGIRVVLSNPSFEVWLLLHFEFFTREYRAAAVEKALGLRWRQEFGCDYEKSGKIYERLKSKMNIAIDNARRNRRHHEQKDCALANSSTDLANIVTHLFSLSAPVPADDFGHTGPAAEKRGARRRRAAPPARGRH